MARDRTPANTASRARVGRIVVRGEFGRLLAAAFPECDIAVLSGETHVTALLRDEAEFWGVLGRLCDPRRRARERLVRSMTRSARLAGAATALVIAVVALALASGARGAADPAAQLAQRYAPVVRLVEQKKPCGHGEAYVPTDVNLVLGNPDVALRGPWDKINIVKVAPTEADLKAGLFEYHLDFPGHAVAPSCTYDAWSHEINKGHPPTTYARVVKEAKYPDELALQYW